jgi:hypothetical protein
MEPQVVGASAVRRPRRKAATHVTIVGRRFSVNAIETTLGAKISADGRHITWWSHSDRLVEGEGDSVAYDVFARD